MSTTSGSSRTHGQTGSCFAVRYLRSWCADGSGGRYSGHSIATRADGTRIDPAQPIRSAITVTGIVG
jgi:hypothetical protein